MRDRRVTYTRDKLYPALATLVATNTSKSTYRSVIDTELRTSSAAARVKLIGMNSVEFPQRNFGVPPFFVPPKIDLLSEVIQSYTCPGHQ